MISLSSESEVVIVDSDKKSLSLIKRWFLQKGVKVKDFVDSVEATNYITDLIRPPSIVISDMFFSKGLSGVELADIVKDKFESTLTILIVNKKVPLDNDLLNRCTRHRFLSQIKMKDFLLKFNEVA
jgi:DNA-binding NtrC family response regulator